MKIIFHERFYEVYVSDPAAAAGRMEAIVEALGKDFEFLTPHPASEKDLALVHTPGQIERIKRLRDLYEIALLSAGGAIMAAELAWNGEPAFGFIRPPGHHASPDSCWGFCYFNNIAIAIKKLMKTGQVNSPSPFPSPPQTGERAGVRGQVKKALILDFDLHFGDGTENAFAAIPEVVYFHPEGSDRKQFIERIQKRLEKAEGFDILSVSAGFDRHVQDWGGLLTTEDYRTIGSLIKTYSEKFCQGRRFGVLEGGYNHAVLGQNVRAFLEGMKE
ncbi:MAG: histone deacetylase family protein [Thermodesulfobacteriota bacterium]|nr:histone deacetylase family protein [Thermodesulfobacteriota bacterium]